MLNNVKNLFTKLLRFEFACFVLCSVPSCSTKWSSIQYNSLLKTAKRYNYSRVSAIYNADIKLFLVQFSSLFLTNNLQQFSKTVLKTVL